MNTLLRSLTICILLLLVWQAAVLFWHIPTYILPSPIQVLMTFDRHQHVLASHLMPTLAETVSGFALGILFGCLSAITMISLRPLRLLFWPILIISQAVPVFAIAPLLVIWLGYGMASKMAAAMLMVFFPVASAFYDGLRHTPTKWLDLANSMQAQTWRTFYYIKLPAALPSLASGIRIAAVAAPIGAIAGEWVGSSKGLGYLMLNANARMQIDMMFAALLVIIMLSLALYYCIDKLLNVMVTWPTTQGD